MWPWESAIFAYLCYSLVSHAAYRDAPSGVAVIFAVVAANIPDLVDKPLSWQFAVFPNGYAIGHSIFTSVVVLVAGYAIAARYDRARLGLAFGIGFLSHNIGDAMEHVPGHGVWYGIEHLLWPVVVLPPDPHDGFSKHTLLLLLQYLHDLVRLELTPYFVLIGVITAVTAVVWAYDGFPIARELVAALRGDTV